MSYEPHIQSRYLVKEGFILLQVKVYEPRNIAYLAISGSKRETTK